jgi:S1-C subfamily serine protease
VVPQPVPAQPPAAAGQSALAGVVVTGVTPALIRRFDLPGNLEGVIVQSVLPGSPGEGVLQPGDAIEQINDTAVGTEKEFSAAVAALTPGERAIVLLSRGPARSFAVVGPDGR